MSERIAVHTDAAPVPTGPFSQAVRKGPLVYTAGQAGRNRDTGKMGSVGEQTRWAMHNISAILEAAGALLTDVVKVTLFVKEGSDLAELNAEYVSALEAGGVGPSDLPSRSLVYVPRLKNDEMLVEIEAVAVVG